MSDHNQQDLFLSIKNALDESEQTLDSETLTTLQIARNSALEKAPESRQPLRWFSAVAIAGLVGIVIWQQQPGWQQPLDDGYEEILLTEENSELVDDLDFYRWLEKTAELEATVNS